MNQKHFELTMPTLLRRPPSPKDEGEWWRTEGLLFLSNPRIDKA